METLKINYNSSKTELCEIGSKYDTDKSSQRKNVTNQRHCHPYTLFYDSLFRNKKNDSLKIAELGILHGSSLRMWQEYFINSQIYGFEYDNNLINNFKKQFNNDRITLSNIDVTKKDSIVKTFSELNIMYDIIIEDTTHQFEDQIRIIENIYPFLKPGGILIIEDVFKSYNEKNYIDRLNDILHYFQDYYFIELDHNNRNSTGWNNDKLFILVKGGDQPIFKNNNKMTIITPSYRVDNLLEVKNSINFDYVDEWIIVYDGSKIAEKPNLFENFKNDKIKEYIYKGEGISGNPQRNYALTTITNPDTLLYFLDDDNIINPKMYKLLDIIDNTKMYTFDQFNRIKGNNINLDHIDIAMCIVPYNLCNNINWINYKYNADGYYIIDCYNKNKNNHIYVNNELCYYNKITSLDVNKPNKSQKNNEINKIKVCRIKTNRYKMSTIINNPFHISIPNSIPNSNNRLYQLFTYK
jgi:predicted O-methyltransferase YrrM